LANETPQLVGEQRMENAKRPWSASLLEMRIGTFHAMPKKTLRALFHRRRSSKLLFAVALSTFVVTFIAAFALRVSLARGRLSIPPIYDDVVYLYWSQQILHAPPHSSIFSVLYQMLDQHSPLTTLFGVVGYTLFEAGDVGPYIVAATALVPFVTVCALLLEGLPLLAIIGIIGAVGSLPILRNFVTEFRPEPAWAALTAISAIAFFRMDLFSCTRRRQIAVGLLIGLTVISKPTTSPLTMVILAGAFLAAGAVSFIEQRRSGSPPRLQSIAAGVATVLIAALVVIIPVGAIIGHEIYNYIVWVMSDVSTQVKYEGGFVEHALFYSTRSSGRLMLGASFPIFLTIWIAGIAYVALRQPSLLPRILAVLLVVLMSYAVPSASVVKFVWFGAAFYSILIIATLYLIGLLYRLPNEVRLPPYLKVWIPRSIFVIGVVLFFRFNLMDQPSQLFGMDAEARADLTDRTERTWSILEAAKRIRMASESPGRVSNVMTIASEPIVGSVISLYGIKEGLPIRALEFSYARSVDELVQSLPEMDYVVVAPSSKQALSGAMLGDGLRAVMNERQDFSRIATVPLRSGVTANIYERNLKEN
jgi:hypothetical protein